MRVEIQMEVLKEGYVIFPIDEMDYEEFMTLPENEREMIIRNVAVLHEVQVNDLYTYVKNETR